MQICKFWLMWLSFLSQFYLSIDCTIAGIKSGTSNFCQWKIRCSSSFIVILPLIIVIEIWHCSNWQFKIYFMLLFSFSKCPLLLINVDFDWDFALNKFSLRAYLHSYSLFKIHIDCFGIKVDIQFWTLVLYTVECGNTGCIMIMIMIMILTNDTSNKIVLETL
jgi:hypothetical protein